jgi:lipopolysaccharide heptosyltransferase I
VALRSVKTDTMTLCKLPRNTDISGRKAGSPRILIVRLSAVGDCLQTMPLACAARQHWSNAHITWIVEKGAAPLVEANDAVDRVIVLPMRFATSPRILGWLRKELTRDRFDFTLDPQGLTKSGLVAWLSGSARRIGFAHPAAREINPWLQTELVASRAAHRVERYLELLRPLGIECASVRFGLSIPSAAEEMAVEFANRAELRGGFVALNPGAGWDSKRWPIERYAEVARHLAARGTPSIVSWGGELERAWAQTIVTMSQGAATLAPPTSLLELGAILRRARLFVGSDTGPLHLAAALGTPCVALFGASSSAACGPYGIGHICLQEAIDESAGRKRPDGDNWAMRRISVEAACAACVRALEHPRAAAPAPQAA